MPVKIYSPQMGSAKDSKAAKVAMGFATGGPVGAGLALASANNPALGGALSLGGSAGAVGRRISDQTSLEAPAFGSSVEEGRQAAAPDPTLGVDTQLPQQDTAISRRMQMMQQDPAHAIGSGLEALRDPSVSQEIRDQYAPVLLRSRYSLTGRF